MVFKIFGINMLIIAVFWKSIKHSFRYIGYISCSYYGIYLKIDMNHVILSCKFITSRTKWKIGSSNICKRWVFNCFFFNITFIFRWTNSQLIFKFLIRTREALQYCNNINRSAYYLLLLLIYYNKFKFTWKIKYIIKVLLIMTSNKLFT